MNYVLRFYRDWVKQDDLTTFEVKLRETDLSVRAHSDLRDEALEEVKRVRRDIEVYAETHPGFLQALTSWQDDPSAPEVVRQMLRSTALYGVGPMAAVAGAVAEAVGRKLLEKSPEVIVENGGDIFLRMDRPVKLLLYSGEESPFNRRLVFRIDAPGECRGACTSSARVGPSLSFGETDAVLAVAANAALADAAATGMGNRVLGPEDVTGVLEEEKSRGLLRGAVVTVGGTFGAFGEVQLEEL
jgi:uncharacterized protein